LSQQPVITELTIGFIPLTDSAPLVVAQEMGFFKAQGLHVCLSKEASWSNIRDKLVFGEIQAAHILAPMLVSTSLGVGCVKKRLMTAYSFGLNGNAISVSNDLYQAMIGYAPEIILNTEQTSLVLKQVVESRKAYGLPKLRFGVVFPFSMHNLLLQYWLSEAGIDSDQEVEIVVVPPSRVSQALEQGLIDGYCVGEPWNTYAAKAGIGVTIVTGYDIWTAAPEKVLGVTQQWAEKNPNQHQKLIVALYQASEWIDQAENHAHLIELLSREEYLAVPEASISNALKGEVCYPLCDSCRKVPKFHIPFQYQANLPWLSHAEWMIEQLKLRQLIPSNTETQSLAASLYFPEVYRQAVSSLGVQLPQKNQKTIGDHSDEWRLDGFAMSEDRLLSL